MKEYITLRNGDLIEEGDEVLGINGKWRIVRIFIGCEYNTLKFPPHRRLLEVEIEDLY